jgi:ubiquinone/menaquinone biosynthesis C-methylase UbiE
MAEQQIRFDDGAAYERMMGVWSGIAGKVFLDWLQPAKNLTWADIGCGNGAFTQLIVERCVPKRVFGIDPSDGQIAYARTRLASAPVEMFFVPDPRKGIAEMMRVTRPGGLVAAYVWDLPGGGFPADPIWVELVAAGRPVPQPPSATISNMDELKALWSSSLDQAETKVIEVERRFSGFDDYWEACTGSASIKGVVNALSAEQLTQVKARVRERIAAKGNRFTARANAAKGRVTS